MTLETPRLLLRPWLKSDAETLYDLAKDPRIGPIAGWPVHTDIEDSRRVIANVFSADETYAMTIKPDHAAVGSIGLMLGEKSNLRLPPNAAEIGYWIGTPYWGRGLVPEAVRVLLHHAFTTLRLHSVWLSYVDGNDNSRRVSEKCGFTYQHTAEKDYPTLGGPKPVHSNRLTAEEWANRTAKHFG